jgi:hypothetical protein
MVATCVASPNGLEWRPLLPGAPLPGQAAIGVDFVFQPAAAPGNPTVPPGASNVYQTETALWAAINASLAVTAGPIWLAIDSSQANATFTQSHNWKKRVWLTGADGGGIVFATDNVLAFADGTVQTDLTVMSRIQARFNSLAGSPSPLTFTGTSAKLSLEMGSQLANLGAHAIADVVAGQTLNVYAFDSTWLAVGAGAIFGLPLGAGTTLQTFLWTRSTTGSPNNWVSGIAGAGWNAGYDASWVPGTFANFLGNYAPVFFDVGAGVAISQAVQPALLTSLTFIAGLLTAQQAIDMHFSPVNPVGAAYTFDATQLDQCVPTGVAGIVYTVPAGFPIGRELTMIDSSNTVGGNAFTIQPAAGEHIGPLLNGAPVTYTQLLVKALTIKKTAPTEWRVISDTALV